MNGHEEAENSFMFFVTPVFPQFALNGARHLNKFQKMHLQMLNKYRYAAKVTILYTSENLNLIEKNFPGFSLNNASTVHFRKAC